MPPSIDPSIEGGTPQIFTQYYLAGLSQASHLLGDETTGRAVQVVGVTTGVRRGPCGGVAHQQTSGAERQEETVVRIEGDRVGPFGARSRRRPRSVSWNDRLQAVRGEWSAAEDGLQRVIADADTRGMLGRQGLPTLAVLAVRQGRATPRRSRRRPGERRAGPEPARAGPDGRGAGRAGWLTSDPARGDLARTLLPRLEAAAASGSAVS